MPGDFTRSAVNIAGLLAGTWAEAHDAAIADKRPGKMGDGPTVV